MLDARDREWRSRSSGVDDVRPVKGEFLGTVEDGVNRLDALREAMVLVGDLVLPRPKSSAAVDVQSFELGQENGECGIPLERRDRVPILETLMPGVVNLAAR